MACLCPIPGLGRSSGEGNGGTNQESNMKTYVTICKIDNKWEFAV